MGRLVSQRIEVLLKKASVDPAFKAALVERRGEMARQIGLSLEPAEEAMLRAVPAEQLETIIARTSVPDEHRRAFLGQAAAAMLAALGIVAVRPGEALGQVESPPFFGGVRPDNPPDRPPNPDLPPGGIRPDMPPKKPKTLDERVIGIIAKQLKVEEKEVTPEKSLVDDLGAKPKAKVQLRKALEKEFSLKIPSAAFGKLKTVEETVDYVKRAIEKQKPSTESKDDPAVKSPTLPPDFPPVAGGVRPK
jgi:acyl carrier protein